MGDFYLLTNRLLMQKKIGMRKKNYGKQFTIICTFVIKIKIGNISWQFYVDQKLKMKIPHF